MGRPSVSTRQVLAALRDAAKTPRLLVPAVMVVLVGGGLVAVTKVAVAPAAAKTRVVYVPTPVASPVPGPTVTVSLTPAPAPTRTVRVTASPSPTKPQQLRCSSPQVYLTLTTDHNSYQQGRSIHFTAVLRRADPPNSEYQHFDPRPCVVDPGGFTVYLTDESNQPVNRSAPFFGIYAIPQPYGADEITLKRGGSYRVPYTWDGTIYDGTSSSSEPAYAGTYHAVAEWMYPYASSAQVSFHVDGPSKS